MSGFVVDFETQQLIDFLLAEASKLEQKKAVKKGLMNAARIFVARGKLNLQTRLLGHGGVGNLMRAFRTKWRQKNLTAYAGFFRKGDLGARAQFGNHAHLVDLGSGPRFTDSGAYQGVMPANYFWHDARFTEEKAAYEAIYDGVQEAIQRMQSRLN
ncbi:MAG: hypothetical protein IJN55_08150 [Alistipes sp.]|nr:hypothetical protein [Alistipes sp.]